MTPPADLSTLLPSEKDALIAALLARVKALLEEVEELRTENAPLRDKLSLPPKTPRNSSKPPSQEIRRTVRPSRSRRASPMRARIVRSIPTRRGSGRFGPI